jgi:hypothetical protein
METLKGILDPYKEGVRRAVITDTGLVRDKKYEPEKNECAVLSEVCRVVFDAEPRDIDLLLEKTYINNIQSAWNALYDDVKLGLVVPRVEMYMKHIMAHMRGSTSAKQVYISGKLAVAYAKKTETVKLHEPFDTQATVNTIKSFATDELYPDLIETYQEVIQYTIPSIEDVANVIQAQPDTCALFLKHPHLDHLCTLFPDLLMVLSSAASTVHVAERQPYMMMMALLVRHGHRVDSPVALDTLAKLRSTKFHLNLAAASAIVASTTPRQDPTVTSLCMLVETLCTVIQKSCHIDILDM